MTGKTELICAVCDGGPGNAGVCACGLKAWEAVDATAPLTNHERIELYELRATVEQTAEDAPIAPTSDANLVQKGLESMTRMFLAACAELPRPACTFADHSCPAFSARQMREYAQAALAAQSAVAPTADAEEDAYLIDRLAKILAGVAIALKGPEEALHRHGYHDLVELAQALKLEVDLYRSQAVPTADAQPGQVVISHPVTTTENAATVMYGLLDSFVEVAAAFPTVKVGTPLAGQVRIYLPAQTTDAHQIPSAHVDWDLVERMREGNELDSEQSGVLGRMIDQQANEIDSLRRAIAVLSAQPAQAAPGITFSVSIATYEESHRTTYHVMVDRSDRPTTDLLDEIGRINVFHSEIREHAEIERAAWEAFLCGSHPTRHIDFVTGDIAAQPPQPTEAEWVAKLRKELLLSKMTHTFTFTRDEVVELLGGKAGAFGLTAVAQQGALTDEQIDAIAEGMPGGLDGFSKGWGWRQFARAILQAVQPEEAEALRDMLESARFDFTAVRESLDVPYEPHQSLLERTIDKARVLVAASAKCDPGPYDFNVNLGERMYIDSSQQYRNGTVTLTIKRKTRAPEGSTNG
jgi:hypothetical protein